jgi:hypothetical protein
LQLFYITGIVALAVLLVAWIRLQRERLGQAIAMLDCNELIWQGLVKGETMVRWRR